MRSITAPERQRLWNKINQPCSLEGGLFITLSVVDELKQLDIDPSSLEAPFVKKIKDQLWHVANTTLMFLQLNNTSMGPLDLVQTWNWQAKGGLDLFETWLEETPLQQQAPVKPIEPLAGVESLEHVELTPTSPSKTQKKFEQTIKQLEKEYQTQLTTALKDPALTSIFLNHPDIKAHLTRPSDTIDFLNDAPVLCPMELAFYDSLLTKIPFRENIMDNSFYQVGTSNECVEYMVDHALSSLAPSNTEINVVGDIYNIRDYIGSKLFLVDNPPIPNIVHIPMKKNGASFLLFIKLQDTHASIVLSIIDPTTRQDLVSISINSSDPGSFERLSTQFNAAPRSYREKLLNFEHLDRKKVHEELYKKFGINIDEPLNDSALFVDESTSCVCVIDPNYEANRSWLLPEIAQAYLHHSRVYIVGKNNTLSLEHKMRTPLINASHNLQVASDDFNCGLYSYNIGKAILHLLSDEVSATEILTLAKKYNESHNEQAKQRLQAIFQEDLRTLLPEYYQDSTSQKSVAALKKTHLHQRWDMGSDYVKSGMLETKLNTLSKTITKTELNHILSGGEGHTGYHTTSWFYYFFGSLLHLNHRRSGTIIALFNLLDQEKNQFEESDIKNAIASSTDVDKHALHRLSLFEGQELKNGTSTDDIIDEIRIAFKNKL